MIRFKVSDTDTNTMNVRNGSPENVPMKMGRTGKEHLVTVTAQPWLYLVGL
jgi:hypothetical protein